MTAIFLDNNSTTPQDPRVTDKFVKTQVNFFGNPSSNHLFGWRCQELIEIAKTEIASLVNAEPENVIFTSGATEANNLAIAGFFKKNSQIDLPLLASSRLEHSSVLSPLKDLESQGAKIEFFSNNQEGIITPSLNSIPKFISIHHSNNEIGSIQDIISFRKTFPNTFIHVDACQSAGKLPIDIKAWGVDCITISAHKAHGPIGIGALIFRDKNLFTKISQQILGGGQQHNLRSGTLPTSLIAAFGETATIAKSELNQTREHLTTLSKVFLEKLEKEFNKFELVGPKNLASRLPGNLSIQLKNVSADRILSTLATKLAFSTGSSCQSNVGEPSHVLKALALDKSVLKETIRIGIGKFNTVEEITFAAEQIGKVARSLDRP